MQVPSKLIVVLVIVATFQAGCVENAASLYGMDSKDTCLEQGARMHYLEDGESAIIVGKISAEQQTVTRVCKIKFKPLSKEGKDYIRLKFDNFYINDCTITLDISQSSDSTFDTDVAEMVFLACNQRSPHVLFAKRDRTVQLKLSRDDIYFRNYNFRINVSLSGGPPKTGPSVALTIGISAALVAIITIIAFVLIKYIRMKNSVLRERRAERAIESALYLYNSQEIQEREEESPYTTIPAARANSGANLSIGASQNGMVNGSRTSDERQSLLTVPLPNNKSNGHPLPRRSGEGDMIPPEYSESKDCLEIEGELPPSYEEALEMPKPPNSPVYINT